MIKSDKVAVVVASLGRPDDLSALLYSISIQTRQPDVVAFSVVTTQDLPDNLDPSVKVLFGHRGAAAQRNRAVEMLVDNIDIIIFFDDDYVPAPNFLESVCFFFNNNPDVYGATGLVIADGVKKGGIPYSTAQSLVSNFAIANSGRKIYSKDIRSVYGCNMIFRTVALKYERFDENLPLNSWQEDVDLAARVAELGRVVYTNQFFGVHCGVTRGRGRGDKVGYSQIANPLYLLAKGTMSGRHAAKIISKNFLANHVRCLWPERYIDRKGRVRGNWKAIYDLCKRRMHPTRVLDV